MGRITTEMPENNFFHIFRNLWRLGDLGTLIRYAKMCRRNFQGSLSRLDIKGVISTGISKQRVYVKGPI